MNPFYSKLQQALDQGTRVTLATAVDCLVEFSGSYDMLIAQKAFLAQDQLTAETPSMAPFWQAQFSGASDMLPDITAQDTFWTYFDGLESPFPDGVLDKLAAGESLVLATVIAKAGSVHKLEGAKLAVSPDGTVFGATGNAAVDEAILETVPSVRDEYVPRLLECTLDSSNVIRILLEPVN